MKDLQIIKAEYVEDLSVRLFFNDGHIQVVDIGKFISQHPHPQYNKYLKKSNFKKFKIENGNIVWGTNWDIIFPQEDLYNGNI